MSQSTPQRLRAPATIAIALAAVASMAIACSESGDAPSPAATKPAATKPAKPPEPSAAPKPAQAPATDPAALAKRGRSVYMANCIACHSQNPAQDGALGPAVTGSSRELIEARVMRGEYPDGYTPKRPSKVMIPLPHLEGELDALAAFLAAES